MWNHQKMFTRSFLLLLIVSCVFAGPFDDEVTRKVVSFITIYPKTKAIVNEFWANNVTLTVRGYQRSLIAIEPDVVPVAFSNGRTFAIYIERGRGRAIILTSGLLDNMKRKNANIPLVNQWLDILFNGTQSSITDDRTARDGSGIALTWKSGDFDVDELYDAWIKGETGPLFVESINRYDDSFGMTKMADKLGCMIEGLGINVFPNPVENLIFEAKDFIAPLNLLLMAYLEDIEKVNQYPLFVIPRSSGSTSLVATRYKSSAEIVLQILLKYQDLLNAHMPTPTHQHSLTDPDISREALAVLNDFLFYQGLAKIPQEDLNQLRINISYGNALIDNSTKVMPTLGDYTVTLNSSSVDHMPTTLFHMPNTVYEYEIVSGDYQTVYFITGHLSDSLINLNSIRRMPYVRSWAQALGTNNTFYSYIGGPISVQYRGTGNIVIKFKNVAVAPHFDIRLPESIQRWKSGYFNDTAIGWTDLICDAMWFTFETDVVQEMVGNNVEDVCDAYDTMMKVMTAFSGGPKRNKMQIVSDYQPNVGVAHSGNPIVTSYSWQRNMLLNAQNYKLKQPSGWWGVLHEIGHNLQNHDYTLRGFTEVTNNVMVLYAQEEFAYHVPGIDYFHGVYISDEKAAKFVLNQPGGLDNFFGYLHYYAYLTRDLGWAAIGNTFNRYQAEPRGNRTADRWVQYLSEETKLNMAPYTFFYRFPSFVDENATYRLFSHLPVYRPNHVLLNLTQSKWKEMEAYFGFEDQTNLPYSFNPDANIGKPRAPSPVIEKYSR